MAAPQLYLHQELLLMALHDEKGTINWRAEQYGFAIGGALLAELFLAEAVTVVEGKKSLVEVSKSEVFGDDLLDECLSRVAASKRRRGPADWVGRFANLAKLRHRIATSLCRRGVLRADERTILLIFSRKIYPTLDPAPERRIKERLQRAIFTDSTRLQPRTVLLVSLADAAGMLPIYFDKKRLKERKRRIKQLGSGQFVAGATRDAIEAAQAAVAAATIAATTTTVITSS